MNNKSDLDPFLWVLGRRLLAVFHGIIEYSHALLVNYQFTPKHAI